MSVLGALRRLYTRTWFWSSLLLALALTLAFTSSLTLRRGQSHVSALLALAALFSAVVSCLVLVPRLAQRFRLDFLDQLRFLRFTGRGAAFLFVVVIIVFAALNTGNNLLYLVVSFLLAAFIVSGLVSNLVLHGLKISLSVPQAIHAQQRALFFVTLENLKRFAPSFALRLKLHRPRKSPSWTPFFLTERLFPYVLPGEKLQLDVPGHFEQRGIYSIEGFEVWTTFPFGFLSRGRKLDASGKLVVYPELLDLDWLMQRHPGLMGSREIWDRGSGTGLYNIRTYRGGDSTRFVHWKSTAKLSNLMVKDFAREEELPMNLFFFIYLADPDSQRLAFEKAVSYLASLVRYYSSGGRRFFFQSSEFQIKVNVGNKGSGALMEYLARVQPAEKEWSPSKPIPPYSVVFSPERIPGLQGVIQVNYLKLA